MAIWFMRLSAVICLSAIVGVVGLTARDIYREAAHRAALAAAEQRVQSLGGSLSREVTHEDYVVLLHDSQVSDAQIMELVALLRPLATSTSPSPDVPKKFAFNLSGTRVGDPAVQAISTLPVAWLNLNGTQITDQGLLHLREQRQLSIVTVVGTRVTRPGIEAVRDSLPQVWIPVPERVPPRRFGSAITQTPGGTSRPAPSPAASLPAAGTAGQ